MKHQRTIIFLVHLLFGGYLLNLSIHFLEIPKFISNFNEIIFLISGILILLAGIISLKNKRILI